MMLSIFANPLGLSAIVGLAMYAIGWLGGYNHGHEGVIRERTAVAVATSALTTAATNHGQHTSAQLESDAERMATELAAKNKELEGLRHALADKDRDPVVYDERFADWLRSGASDSSE